MTRLLSVLLALLVLASVSASSVPVHAQQQSGDVLIRNATVLTVTQGTLENTDILVRDGRIDRIGAGLSAPGDIRVIDASGKYVMPGIIDAHSHIGISNVNEATNPVTAEVTVDDVLNPHDINIYRALAGGVTVSQVMHGSANVIGGRNSTIKHRYGVTDPAMLRMEGAPETIKFALGENPTRVHGRGNNVVPGSRMGVEFVIREAFEKARRYTEDRAQGANTRAALPAYNERMEILSRILSGDIMIHAHSYRADEILMLLDVVEDYGIDRIVFQHVNEGFKVAPELSAYGAMASVFSDWWAFKFEVYYSTAYNASILTRNGVVTSINSDSPEVNRHLFHEAAKTQRYGDLDDDEALALITINPAIQLGIGARTGSIEEGKDADLVIFDRHPLSVYAIPQQTIVDGVVRFDRSADPDDMRLFFDPTVQIETYFVDMDNHEGCMQGVNLHEFAESALH